MKFQKPLILILFAATAFAIYFNSLNNGFFLDDIHHITANPYLKTPANIPLFFTDFRTFSTAGPAHYRPMVLVSHSLNYYLGGLNPEGYRILTLLFHIGSAFLIFLIVQSIFSRIIARSGNETRLAGFHLSKGIFASIVSGMIFLTTPFNSEAINYLSARSNVLCAFFYLFAFWCWVKYREETVYGATLKRKWGFYIASIFIFLLAMLTKEVAITLPIALLIFDVLFVPGKRIFDYLRYIPFIAVAFIAGIMPRFIFVGEVVKSGAPRELRIQMLTGIKVTARYIYSMLLPVNLNALHVVREPASLTDTSALASLALLIIILAVSFRLWRDKRPVSRVLLFFILWFFLSLALIAILPLSLAYQESRGYLASSGLAIIAGILIESGIWRLKISERTRYATAAMILFIIIVVSSALVVNRNMDWRSGLTLWTDSIDKAPSSFFAHGMLAEYYAAEGQYEEAVKEMETAIRVNPDYFAAYELLGQIYAMRGETKKAREMFHRSIALSPYNTPSHRGLARIYLEEGSLEEARTELIKVLNISPNDIPATRQLIEIFSRKGELDIAENNYLRLIMKDQGNPALHQGLGLIYQRKGEWDKAISEYQEVLTYTPGETGTLLDLSSAYSAIGDVNRAEETMRKAVSADPDNAEVNLASGIFYYNLKKYDLAKEAFEKTIKINPASFKAYNNLGLIYHGSGDNRKAIELLNRAITISPSYHRARINLAWVYESEGRKDLAIREYNTILQSAAIAGTSEKWSEEFYEEARNRLKELR